MVRTIAIIPARGGSKRLPKKNILDFKGKPMIAWTIEAALKSDLFTRIIVSTDAEEIREISLEYGAEVPFLRVDTADDYSPVSLATAEALVQAESFFKEKYHHVVQLMANCPLRDAYDITSQYEEFCNDPHETSLLSGFSYGMFNPFWAHRLDDNGQAHKLFDESYFRRSQDLPRLLCPSGATWISNRERLLTQKTFYSSDYRMFEIPWNKAVDIDDYHDLDFAKIVFDYGKSI